MKTKLKTLKNTLYFLSYLYITYYKKKVNSQQLIKK